MADSVVAEFHWLDYLLFSLMLGVSAVIGVAMAIRRRRQRKNTTDDMTLGGRDMGILPVSISILASFLSAITVIGSPLEVYLFGATYWQWIFMSFITYPVVAHVFLPFFHNLQLPSAYEYLELRFNKVIRVMGSLVYNVQMLFYMAIVLYAPALALSQVTGLSMLISVVAAGLVCTFYTAIGGLKAVVWTDVFQMTVVTAGMLALIIQGSNHVGGIKRVFEIAEAGDRLPKWIFDPNPLIRHTIWTLTLGGTMTGLAVLGGNQAILQRYTSIRKQRDAQIAVYLNLPANIFFTSLVVLTGLVLYAWYHVCDPIVSRRVSKADQLLPLFVMEAFSSVPGLAGLFVACVFGAALSTVSSGVNALATVTLYDFVMPAYEHCTRKPLKDKGGTRLIILIAGVYGLATIGLAFAMGELDKTILQIAFSIFGLFGGPLLGLIIAGMFFPWVNVWGAGAGLLCSLAATLWLGIGTIVHGVTPTPLSLSISGCARPLVATANATTATTTIMATFTEPAATVYNVTSKSPDVISSEPSDFYNLSYQWYSGFAVLVCLLTAHVVSAFTCYNMGRKIPPVLLFPSYHKWRCISSGMKEKLSIYCPEEITNATAGKVSDKEEITSHVNSIARADAVIFAHPVSTHHEQKSKELSQEIPEYNACNKRTLWNTVDDKNMLVDNDVVHDNNRIIDTGMDSNDEGKDLHQSDDFKRIQESKSETEEDVETHLALPYVAADKPDMARIPADVDKTCSPATNTELSSDIELSSTHL